MIELILNDTEKKALQQVLSQQEQTSTVSSILRKLQRADAPWFAGVKDADRRGYDT